MFNLMKEMLLYVYGSILHNALILILGVLIAALIKVYVNPERFKKTLLEKSNVSIMGSVAFGAFTPLCACGTMAVIVSMLTTALPWGPIMAFLTSSPLMSPDQFVLLSGIIGVRFALALTVASVIIGLGSGYITNYIERHTGFLSNQARFTPDAKAERMRELRAKTKDQELAATKSVSFYERFKIGELLESFVDIGLKKVLLYFAVFSAVGYLINKFIPTELIMSLFNSKNIFAVPLAALIGLPLYVSGPASIPIIKVLTDAGASGGAILAFMITGPGTSAGVIAGIATIMRKRAIALYVGFILVGGIILGYAYELLSAFI